MCEELALVLFDSGRVMIKAVINNNTSVRNGSVSRYKKASLRCFRLLCWAFIQPVVHGWLMST